MRGIESGSIGWTAAMVLVACMYLTGNPPSVFALCGMAVGGLAFGLLARPRRHRRR